jgi:hypothetical protein
MATVEEQRALRTFAAGTFQPLPPPSHYHQLFKIWNVTPVKGFAVLICTIITKFRQGTLSQASWIHCSTQLLSPRSQLILSFHIQLGAGIAQSVPRRAGRPGFDSRQGKIFLFPTASRPALRPTQWVSGEISPGAKRLGREADHSPPSSAEVKNGGAMPSLPHTSSSHSA